MCASHLPHYLSQLLHALLVLCLLCQADVGDGDHSVTRFVLSVSSDGDLAPDRRDGRCPVGCQTAVTTTDSCDIFVELSTGGRRSSGLPAGLASSSDWKVERSLEDCHRLHERLSQVGSLTPAVTHA